MLSAKYKGFYCPDCDKLVKPVHYSKKIIKYLQENKFITIKKLSELENISERTACIKLNNMVNNNLIIKIRSNVKRTQTGLKGRNLIYYVISEYPGVYDEINNNCLKYYRTRKNENRQTKRN